MRHLIGIGLVVLLSAAVFFGGGWPSATSSRETSGPEWFLLARMAATS